MFANTDQTGRVTSTRHDTAGRPVSVTGPTVTTTHENSGRVSRIHAPNGIVTSTYKNTLGDVTRVTTNVTDAPSGEPVISPVPGFERTIETREYADNTSRITVTDAHGRQAVTVVDVFGRPTTTTTVAGGLAEITVYDDVANTVTTGVTATPERGLAGALRTSMRHLDGQGNTRTVGARADGVTVPEASTRFDGLGRLPK